MNEQIRTRLAAHPPEIHALFQTLRQLVYESVPVDLEETLWARMPSYCHNAAFVRLIPFKDHINIEAAAIRQHQSELTDYRLTPKGMLQLYIGQPIPAEVLRNVFAETLCSGSEEMEEPS